MLTSSQRASLQKQNIFDSICFQCFPLFLWGNRLLSGAIRFHETGKGDLIVQFMTIKHRT